MRAPVYRNLEAKDSFLGLAFPFEALIFCNVAGWALTKIHWLPLKLGLPLATYLFFFLAGYKRAPLFVQHYLDWKWRQLRGGGVLSAAARSAAVPTLPYAKHVGFGHSRGAP